MFQQIEYKVSFKLIEVQNLQVSSNMADGAVVGPLEVGIDHTRAC